MSSTNVPGFIQYVSEFKSFDAMLADLCSVLHLRIHFGLPNVSESFPLTLLVQSRLAATPLEMCMLYHTNATNMTLSQISAPASTPVNSRSSVPETSAKSKRSLEDNSQPSLDDNSQPSLDDMNDGDTETDHVPPSKIIADELCDTCDKSECVCPPMSTYMPKPKCSVRELPVYPPGWTGPRQQQPPVRPKAHPMPKAKVIKPQSSQSASEPQPMSRQNAMTEPQIQAMLAELQQISSRLKQRKNKSQRDYVRTIKKRKTSHMVHHVEYLKDVRLSADGKTNEYLVHWAGYEDADDSWEPASGIKHGLDAMIDDMFENVKH